MSLSVPSIYNTSTNNRIVCAATRFININDQSKSYTLIGARHMDDWMREQIARSAAASNDDTHKIVQGFIDQRGNFYTRTEAWKVALAEGQIIRRCGGDATDGGTLYSENLY